jgi:callose synthase
MQVFTISQKASAKKAKLHLVVRLFQAALFMFLIAGAIVAIVVSPLSLTDCFAVALAIVPTGWGLISVSYLFSFITYSGH